MSEEITKECTSCGREGHHWNECREIPFSTAMAKTFGLMEFDTFSRDENAECENWGVLDLGTVESEGDGWRCVKCKKPMREELCYELPCQLPDCECDAGFESYE